MVGAGLVQASRRHGSDRRKRLRDDGSHRVTSTLVHRAFAATTVSSLEQTRAVEQHYGYKRYADHCND